jgi:hypothetical protein
MTTDFNNAGEQKTFEVIPDGTIADMQMRIRPGNAGEGGLLKRSKNGDAEGLDAELVILDGPYAKRKFWSYMITSGTTDGHATAADITNRRLRAILECARGLKPTDVSEEAKAKRVAEYSDFDGVRFVAKIGVEPGSEQYPKAKNVLAEIVTPDRKEWHQVEQVAVAKSAPAAQAAASTTIAKPAWAA